jgi:hypothetical protein
MSILCLSLALHALAQESAGGSSSSQVVQAERLMEAAPSQRIRGRNLFHPKRGLSALANEPSSSVDSLWPTLAGTQLGKGYLGALLKFPGAEESRFLGIGDSADGFQLQAVQRDRVTLLDLKAGKTKSLDLNPERSEGGASASELEQLFHPPLPDRGKKGKP